MKNLIKENLALTIGIILPMVLILIFAAAAYLPRIGVTPPQHDLLFTTTQNYVQNQAKFYVKNKKLYVYYTKTSNGEIHNRIPMLYRFNAQTQQVRKVSVASLNLPVSYKQPHKDDTVVDIILPETNTIKMNPELKSADGYIFNSENGYYSSGSPLSWVFSRSRHRQQASIVKGGYIVSLKHDNQYMKVRLLGWIVEEK